MAWHSTHRVEAMISVILFAILLVNPIAGEKAPHWLAEHVGIGWVCLVLLFVHIVMQAVYEKYAGLESERDALRVLLGGEGFSARLDRVLWVDPPDASGIGIFLWMVVTNRGKQSILDRWDAKLYLSGEELIEPKLWTY